MFIVTFYLLLYIGEIFHTKMLRETRTLAGKLGETVISWPEILGRREGDRILNSSAEDPQILYRQKRALSLSKVSFLENSGRVPRLEAAKAGGGRMGCGAVGEVLSSGLCP